MIRWFFRLFFLAILVAVGFGAVSWYQGRAERNAPAYQTVPVKRAELLATIGATGTLEPQEVVDVGAQVAGQIIRFGNDSNGHQVDYRSPVKAGMLLAQIDDSLYQADYKSATAAIVSAKAGITRAQADLVQLQAKLQQAQNDWDRAQKLGPSQALAQTNYDSYKAAFEVAKANVGVGHAGVEQAESGVTQAEAALVRIQRNLDYCTIASPVDGVIIDRRVNIGQTVVASLNAPSLFLIAKDLKKMALWVPVNEADIGHIYEGQPVEFDVDAFPGEEFHGTVAKVRLNAQMTQNVVTYTVEVDTDNSSGKLLPYLTANVHFETGRRTDAIVVPNAALRFTPKSELNNLNAAPPPEGAASTGAEEGAGPTTRRSGGGRRNSSASTLGTVWTSGADGVKPIRVKIGLTDGANTEILSENLPGGSQVIVAEQTADEAAAGGSNPFAPQWGRGGRGGRGGGGGGGGRRGG